MYHGLSTYCQKSDKQQQKPSEYVLQSGTFFANKGATLKLFRKSWYKILKTLTETLVKWLILVKAIVLQKEKLLQRNYPSCIFDELFLFRTGTFQNNSGRQS